jgi:hypothetical protein
MPKNNVTDLITDLEMQFARLILSGTMTDRQAAEAVGFDRSSAADLKSKPRVRDYMREHRAAVEQKLIELDAGELRRRNQSRDQVLDRLWEIARLDTEKTRNSASAQVKALSLIIAIEGLVPNRHDGRRAVSAQNQPAPSPVAAQFYKSAWNRTQQNGEPQPPSAQEDVQGEAASQPASGATDAPVSAPEPAPDPSRPTLSPYMRFVPDSRVPFSIPKSFFKHRR